MTNLANAYTSQRHLPDRVVMQAGNLLVGCLFGGKALEDLRDTFARALLFWLKKRQKRGADLARHVGLSPSNVSRWLGGEGATDFVTFGAIAGFLDVPAWYLLHPHPEDLPDPMSASPKIKADEAEQALKYLGSKLGYRVRVELLKKP